MIACPVKSSEGGLPKAAFNGVELMIFSVALASNLQPMSYRSDSLASFLFPISYFLISHSFIGLDFAFYDYIVIFHLQVECY
jgi:hypothetical protein